MKKKKWRGLTDSTGHRVVCTIQSSPNEGFLAAYAGFVPRKYVLRMRSINARGVALNDVMKNSMHDTRDTHR